MCADCSKLNTVVEKCVNNKQKQITTTKYENASNNCDCTSSKSVVLTPFSCNPKVTSKKLSGCALVPEKSSFTKYETWENTSEVAVDCQCTSKIVRRPPENRNI